MDEIERNIQEEEKFSGDDNSSSFMQNSEDIEEEVEEGESEVGRALKLQGSILDIRKQQNYMKPCCYLK